MSVNAAVPRNGWKKCIGAGVGLAVVFVGEVAGLLISELSGLDADFAITAGGALAATLMVLVLGGKHFIRPSLTSILDSFKFMWWIVLISALLMVWAISDYVASGAEVVPNALGACLGSFALCLVIGISEEFEFRGLVTGGILAKSGKSKRGIWAAVLIGALIFGAAHVDWGGLNYADIYSVIQAVLKILQTGMYAVMLSAVMLKTRSLVGVALVHAIDDYLLFVSSSLFGEDLTVEYVTTSSVEDAIATIVFYAIICALYLPTLIKAVRYINKSVNAPEFGPFIPAAEVAALQPADASVNPMPAAGVPVYPTQQSYGWQTGVEQQTMRQTPQPPSYVQPQQYVPYQQGQQGVAAQPYQQQGTYPQSGAAQGQFPQQPYPQQNAVSQPYVQQQYPQQPYAQQQYPQQGAFPQPGSTQGQYPQQPAAPQYPQQGQYPQQMEIPSQQKWGYPQQNQGGDRPPSPRGL